MKVCYLTTQIKPLLNLVKWICIYEKIEDGEEYVFKDVSHKEKWRAWDRLGDQFLKIKNKLVGPPDALS